MAQLRVASECHERQRAKLRLGISFKIKDSPKNKVTFLADVRYVCVIKKTKKKKGKSQEVEGLRRRVR